MSKYIAKPLFKYIGGKTWLRDRLQESVRGVLKHKNIDTYIEPFVGGLGSFLSVEDILFQGGVRNIILNDINNTIIGVYELIKKDPWIIIGEIKQLEWQWMKTVPVIEPGLTHTKEQLMEAEKFYKKIRLSFNEYKGSALSCQAARLVFLQKHSFNGIYRENMKGEHNTPFNWSGKRTDEDLFERVMELNRVFKKFNILFSSTSYEKIDYNHENALYYLDPPYINEKMTENKYNKNHFGKEQQLDLIERIKSSTFIYSNHASKILLDKFENMDGVVVKTVVRKNIMSAKASTRKNDKKEILVIGNGS